MIDEFDKHKYTDLRKTKKIYPWMDEIAFKDAKKKSSDTHLRAEISALKEDLADTQGKLLKRNNIIDYMQRTIDCYVQTVPFVKEYDKNYYDGVVEGLKDKNVALENIVFAEREGRKKEVFVYENKLHLKQTFIDAALDSKKKLEKQLDTELSRVENLQMKLQASDRIVAKQSEIIVRKDKIAFEKERIIAGLSDAMNVLKSELAESKMVANDFKNIYDISQTNILHLHNRILHLHNRILHLHDKIYTMENCFVDSVTKDSQVDDLLKDKRNLLIENSHLNDKIKGLELNSQNDLKEIGKLRCKSFNLSFDKKELEDKVADMEVNVNLNEAVADYLAGLAEEYPCRKNGGPDGTGGEW